MTELSVLPLGNWIDDAPWRYRSVSILCVTDDGLEQAFTLDDKRVLLSRPSPGRYYAAWTGRWKTDVRAIPDDLVQEVRALVR